MVCLLNTTSPTLNIQLDCGQSIFVETFMYDLTYAGLIEGAPNERLNTSIIERALTHHEALWGERQIHMIPPAIDVSDPARPTLPRLNLHAWLTCSEPINPMFDGSQLVVTWFEDECHKQPLAEVISSAIRHLPWKQLARDFDY
jgi:predicted nucleotidyltransferase